MSGYIGNVPVPQSTQNRQDFVATAGQTVFNTLGYEPKYVDVYLNGIKLIDITEYTATNGTDIILTSAASVGDTLSYLSFTNFTIVDSVGDLTVTNISTETLEVGGSGVTIDAILDEDDMVSNSDTAVPTQQSVKTYVDTSIVDLEASKLGIDDNATSTVITLTATNTMEVSGDTTVTGNVEADSFNDVITTDDTVAGGEALGVKSTLPTDRSLVYNGIHVGARGVLEGPNNGFSFVDTLSLTNNGYTATAGVKAQNNGPITRFQMLDGRFLFQNVHASSGSSTPSAGDVISAGNIVDVAEITAAGFMYTQGLNVKENAQFEAAIVEEVHVLSGTSVDLDPDNGTIQTHTLTGNTTYTESLNDGFSMTLMIAPTTNTITWPAMNWVNNDTLPPELGTTGNTVVSLWQVGGTVYGAFVGNSEA